MLSLKDSWFVQRSAVHRKLLDLPDELLHLVIKFLFAENGEFIRDLIPISMTCRRCRNITTPFIFRKLSLRITERYVDHRTFKILLNCQIARHQFAYHVRHLINDDSYCFRERDDEDLRLSDACVKEIVCQGLRALVNVSKVSIGCLDSPLVKLMPALYPSKAFHFRIEICTCSPWTSGKHTSTENLCQEENGHSFDIATHSRSARDPLQSWATRKSPCVEALSWEPAINPVNLDYAAFSQVKELHLNTLSFAPEAATDMANKLPLLSDLRRLSVNGPDLCSTTLSIVNKLTQLESLRLLSPLDRVFHAHLRNHTFEGLPYLRLSHLRSLEIRYISRYLSIEHIVPPNITHLRIEYHNRNERLTSYDLRWIAKVAPQLECLEINTGALANLWHPTAIAGVDVDMEVYGMLEALSSFKNLRTLRLFPSYWRSYAGYLNFVQPVEDLQAVRIFNHLRLQCKMLKLLIISNSYLDYRSRNEVFSRGLSEPMKWVVRSNGAKTQLLTHQAKKNYHLEQIWDGERRLTTHNVRHSGHKRHFDELEEWNLPMYEFPFDERVPCHYEAVSDGDELVSLLTL